MYSPKGDYTINVFVNGSSGFAAASSSFSVAEQATEEEETTSEEEGIRTEAPEEHRKTFESFAQLAKDGIIDIELLNAYQSLLVKAEVLLHIFEIEKGKRTKFTYKKIPHCIHFVVI